MKKPLLVFVAAHIQEKNGLGRVERDLLLAWNSKELLSLADFLIILQKPSDDFCKRYPRFQGMLVSKSRKQSIASWLQQVEELVAQRFSKRSLKFFYPANALPVKPAYPFILIIHDLIELLRPEYYLNPFKTRNIKKVLQASRKAWHIVSVSAFTSHCLRLKAPYIPTEKIITLYNGLDTHKLLAAGKTTALKKQHQANKEKYILYVGGHVKRKNLLSLAKAYQQLPQDLQEEYLFYCVSSSNPALIKLFQRNAKKSNKESRLRLLENIDEAQLNDVYRQASLFVFPSLFEGFGFPVLEAQRAGIPVICGKNTSLAEITTERDAYYVNVSSVKALAAGIETVLRSTEIQKSLVKNAFSNIKRFKKTSFQKQYRNLLKDFIQKA